MKGLVALVSGMMFGVGLAMSGMLDPARILGFLVEKFDAFLQAAARSLGARAPTRANEAVSDVAGLLLIVVDVSMMVGRHDPLSPGRVRHRRAGNAARTQDVDGHGVGRHTALSEG